jgi:hypothetical protein
MVGLDDDDELSRALKLLLVLSLEAVGVIEAVGPTNAINDDDDDLNTDFDDDDGFLINEDDDDDDGGGFDVVKAGGRFLE